MRTLSSDALAKLSEKLGLEPITILDVSWADGKRLEYADRDIGDIPGKIVQLGDLENVVDIQSSTNSQSLSVTLDDVDGTIKDILDTTDIHQRDVWVYQYFDTLSLDDKFLLFKGQITSPIVWNEGDRTVTFSIVSQIEDKEIGFSAEEGDFPFIPKNLVGKSWPILFGKVIDSPALQFNQAVTGTTLCGVGIISGADLQSQVPLGADDCSSFAGIASAQAQANHLHFVASAYRDAGYDNEARQFEKQSEEAFTQIGIQLQSMAKQDECARQQRTNTLNNAEQTGLGCNPIRILGGEDFPQNKPITISIGGGLFTGIMRGSDFTISSRKNADADAKAQSAFNTQQSYLCSQPSDQPPKWDLITKVPCGHAAKATPVPPGKGGSNAGGTTGGTTNPGKNSGGTGDCYVEDFGFVICFTPTTQQPTADQVAQHTWAEAGSNVTLASDEPITYLVSITPGTVLAVKAYKQFQGPRTLVNVPNDLWTVETKNYGPVTAVQVVVKKPLSTIPNQGWSDDLYVTFQSEIGPNTVDILSYIIERWTSLEADETSFDAVKTKVDAFPMNFPILDRENTVDVLKEIAYQARCAIYLDNGKFFLKYLPEEPEVDDTFTVSDILKQTMTIELTSTEELVTKMVVSWHLSWATGNGETPNLIILRHNINKYGTKEEQHDFYCFNQPDIVLKAATFWLIRKANTWKTIKFQTPINKLNLETFDTIQLPAGYVGDAVKAIVQEATFTSGETPTISFTCATPVKAGTKVAYQFYWPASVNASWPTPAEIAAGNAGGLNTIAVLPIGDTTGIGAGGTVFVGGPNIVFLANSGRGDKHPGDVGFSAQQVLQNSVFANVTNSANPNPNLKLNYRSPFKPFQLKQRSDTPTIIDIQTTRIIDSKGGDPRDFGLFKSLIEKVNKGDMFLKGVVNVSDKDKNDATFEMKFDTDSHKFGAERAFLADDES